MSIYGTPGIEQGIYWTPGIEQGIYGTPEIGQGIYGTGYDQEPSVPRQGASIYGRPQQPQMQPAAPPPMPGEPQPFEEDPSIVGSVIDKGLGGLSMFGNLLDLPGSMIRDTMTWLPGGIEARNPFDQLLSPLSHKNRTTGEEILQNAGVYDDGPAEGFWDNAGRFLGGTALEIALDPLTYTGIGLLSRAGGLTSKGGQLARRANLLDDAARVASEAASKKAGKAVKVGPREAMQQVTPRDLARHLDKRAVEASDDLMEQAAEAAQETLARDAVEGYAPLGSEQLLKAYKGINPGTDAAFADDALDAFRRGDINTDQLLDSTGIGTDWLDDTLGGNFRVKVPFMDEKIITDVKVPGGAYVGDALDFMGGIVGDMPIPKTGKTLSDLTPGVVKNLPDQLRTGKIEGETIARGMDQFAERVMSTPAMSAMASAFSKAAGGMKTPLARESFRMASKLDQELEALTRESIAPMFREMQDKNLFNPENVVDGKNLGIEQGLEAYDYIEGIKSLDELSPEVRAFAPQLDEIKNATDDMLSLGEQFDLPTREMGNTLEREIEVVDYDAGPDSTKLKKEKKVIPPLFGYAARLRQDESGKFMRAARRAGRSLRADGHDLGRKEGLRHVPTSVIQEMSINKKFAGRFDQGIFNKKGKLRGANAMKETDTGVMGSQKLDWNSPEVKQAYEEFKEKYASDLEAVRQRAYERILEAEDVSPYLMTELPEWADEALEEENFKLFQVISTLPKKQVDAGVPMYSIDPVSSLLRRSQSFYSQMAHNTATQKLIGQNAARIGAATKAASKFGKERERVIDESVKAFGPKAKQFAPVMDARAETWAAETGRSADEWYAKMRVQRGEVGDVGQGALFQGLPGFFSKLARATDQKVSGKIGWDQYKKTMENADVKPEELEDMGMEEFFKGGPKTKQEIQQYLDENAIEIEVVDGGGMYPEYQVPGGDPGTYQEILITRPSKAASEVDKPVTADWINETAANSPRGFAEVIHVNTGETMRAINAGGDVVNMSNGDVYRPSQLRRVPDVSSDYMAPHFNEPNILAHLRVDDVTLPNGKKSLRVQEVQSDWHQEGRKVGYASEDKAYTAFDSDGEPIGQGATREEAIADAVDSYGVEPDFVELEKSTVGVPDAPFKKSWHMLAMKQVLKEAAENGYEEVSIVRGSDIAQAVDGPPKQLEGFYNKVANDFKKYTKRWGSYQGESQFPSTLDRPIRYLSEGPTEWVFESRPTNWGEKVEGTITKRPDGKFEVYDNFNSSVRVHDSLDAAKQDVKTTVEEGAEIQRRDYTGDVKVFQITDKMRKELLEEGQPLYQGGRNNAKGAVEFAQDGEAIVTAFKSADISTLAHETAHIFRRDLPDDLRQQAEQALGVRNGNWDRAADEAFASGFERYLRDGQAPTPALQKVFDTFRNWLTRIYQSIVGTPLEKEVNPQLKDVFDRAIGAGRTAKPSTTGSAAGGITGGMNLQKWAEQAGFDYDKGKAGLIKQIGGPAEEVRVELTEQLRQPILEKIEDAIPDKFALDDIKSIIEDPDQRLQLVSQVGDVDAKAGERIEKLLGNYDEAQPSLDKILEKFEIDKQLGTDLATSNKRFDGPEEVAVGLELWDAFTDLFKTNVTAPFPRFHVRNVTSAGAQNFFNDIFDPRLSRLSLGRYLRPYGNYLDLRQGNAIEGASEIPGFENLSDEDATRAVANLAFAHGVVDSPGQIHDIVGVSENLLDQFLDTRRSIRDQGRAPEGTTWLQSINPFNSQSFGGTKQGKGKFAPERWGRVFGSEGESMVRVAPFIALLRQGFDPAEAARRVKEIQIDYSDLTEFERNVMRRIMPFYSFQKGATKYLSNELATNPGGKVGMAIKAAENASGNDPGTPEYIRDGLNVPIGWTEDGGRKYITGAGLMHEPPMQLFGPSISDTLFNMAGMLHPGIKAPLELTTNESLFMEDPAGGGRSLDDLDPLLGRTLSNVTTSLGLSDREAPYRFGKIPELIAANSPAAAYLSTIRKAADPRRGIGQRLSDFTTGFRTTIVNPQTRDAVIRGQLEDIMREFGGRTFNMAYMPDEVLATLDPATRAKVQQIQEALKLINNRRRQADD